MEVRNNREEGPEKGLFTEEAGEFVIFRYGNTPQSESAPASDEAESTKEETE